MIIFISVVPVVTLPFSSLICLICAFPFLNFGFLGQRCINFAFFFLFQEIIEFLDLFVYFTCVYSLILMISFLLLIWGLNFCCFSKSLKCIITILHHLLMPFHFLSVGTNYFCCIPSVFVCFAVIFIHLQNMLISVLISSIALHSGTYYWLSMCLHYTRVSSVVAFQLHSTVVRKAIWCDLNFS